MQSLKQSAVRSLLATAAVFVLAAPSQALAAKAEVAGGELRVTAARGESNSVVVTVLASGDIEVSDYRRTPTAGAGCRPFVEDDATPDNNPVLCSPQGVERVAVALGDKADELGLDGLMPPVSYSGGAGSDLVTYRDTGPINVSLDGVANDGPGGRDNVQGDVERIYGSIGADVLIGGGLAVTLDGSDGDDDLRGGAGNDVISAASVSGSGEDLGLLYDEGKDTVRCGGGNDQVFADGDDTVARDCEVVGRPGRYTSSGLNFLYTGSRRADLIEVREFVNAVVKAGRGNDVVRLKGAPSGVLYGEAGNDNLRGDVSPDRFVGGSGNDTIISYTRDRDRDSVSCGPGRDRVIADLADRVAPDCETVTRRR
jgi:hypothetical protein